jgi:hypothetical protein
MTYTVQNLIDTLKTLNPDAKIKLNIRLSQGGFVDVKSLVKSEETNTVYLNDFQWTPTPTPIPVGNMKDEYYQ